MSNKRPEDIPSPLPWFIAAIWVYSIPAILDLLELVLR